MKQQKAKGQPKYKGKKEAKMKVQSNRCKWLFAIVCLLAILHAAARESFAGALQGWGRLRFDKTGLDANDFVAVAAGAEHRLALKADGSILAWGGNWFGQSMAPEGNDFVAISAGGWYSLALKADGSIVAWGINDYGQATTPTGNDFVAIAAGRYHSLALKADGSIVAWGWNGAGQATPPKGNDFVAIAAGGEHSLALKADGSIVGWGDNRYGQATMPAGNDFVAIAGLYHGLALKADGSIVGWGRNNYGQATPPAGNDFVAIAAGQGHSLALKADGSIVGWGWNDDGQASPPEGNDFVAIAAGDACSLAIRSDFPFLPGLIVVDKRRIARTVFEYECRIKLQNYAMFPLQDAEVSLASAPANMTLIDPNVCFLYIVRGGSAVSEDTCKFQVDRLEQLDPKEIIWEMRCQTADTGKAIQFRGSSELFLDAEDARQDK